MSLLNLLRGGVDTVTRARSAGQQAEMQNLPLLAQLQNMAAQRPQQEREFSLNARMKEAQIAEAQARTESLLHPQPRAETPESFSTETTVGPDGKPVLTQIGQRGGKARDVVGPDGRPVRPYEKPPAPKEPKAVGPPAPARTSVPTEVERKALFFFRRAKPAVTIIDRFDKAEALNTLAANAGMFGNWAQTPEGQVLNQAAKQWIQAFLRQDSGAVISKEEMNEAFETYIPRPGDAEEVLAQKREARATVVGALKEMAGRALPEGERGGPAVTAGAAPSGNPFEDLVPKKTP